MQDNQDTGLLSNLLGAASVNLEVSFDLVTGLVLVGALAILLLFVLYAYKNWF